VDAAWIDCGFFLCGQRVNVSVRRLNEDERRRVAAEIAWFAESLLTTTPQSESWSELFNRILSQDVSITLDEEAFSQTNRDWDQLICRTFEAFVTANELGGQIRSQLRENIPRSRSSRRF
jgi:hypothetical protein